MPPFQENSRSFFEKRQNADGLDLRDNRGKRHDLAVVLVGVALAVLSNRDGCFMALEVTARNLISMVELAKANNIRAILSSVLPVNDRVKNKEGDLLVQTRSRPNEKIRAINDWIKKYASENGLVYLDYYSATIDKEGTLKDGISYDGLHPNADGYKIMQSLAEEAITRALRK